ncbi:hypothetical protein [Algibacter mikhailovii]|uniref:hypothetical protein n=1 Tax=Algibacter mikhailovii TaxID=425498 RepID=UPI0024944464|nr:hypothetical protein [Algibacter mikhailovii]
MKFNLGKSYLLIEQGIISLLNFGLIFILSRIVSPVIFKEFFLGYSIVIMISLIASNFANQPLQVFLKKGEGNIMDYISKAILLNILTVLFISILCFLVVYFNYTFLLNDLIFIIILGLLVSIYDLIRRISFVYFTNSFLGNALSSSLIIISVLGISAWLYFFGVITPNSVYIALIIGYLLGVFLILFLKRDFIFYHSKFSKSNTKNVLFLNVLKKHYNYARWLVIGIFFFWFYTQGLYFLGEKYIDIEDFNAVRISQNLVGVLSILFLTFENYMLTKVADVFHIEKHKGVALFVKNTFKKVAFKFIISLICISILILYSYKLYYSNNPFYSEKIIYLYYFFAYQLIFGLSRIFAVALKAINGTKYFFYNHCFTAVITLIISWLFIEEYNSGHTLALILLLSILIFSTGLFLSYKREIAKNI